MDTQKFYAARECLLYASQHLEKADMARRNQDLVTADQYTKLAEMWLIRGASGSEEYDPTY